MITHASDSFHASLFDLGGGSVLLNHKRGVLQSENIRTRDPRWTHDTRLDVLEDSAVNTIRTCLRAQVNSESDTRSPINDKIRTGDKRSGGRSEI